MNNLSGVLGVGDAEMRASPGRRQIRMFARSAPMHKHTGRLTISRLGNR